LSTLLVDFEIPSIVVSPIVEIFPFVENLDKEIDRRPMNEVESSEEQPNGGAVFSASGSDEDDSEESEIEDVTSKDE
jgi:hypothetical protein